MSQGRRQGDWMTCPALLVVLTGPHALQTQPGHHFHMSLRLELAPSQGGGGKIEQRPRCCFSFSHVHLLMFQRALGTTLAARCPWEPLKAVLGLARF